MCGVDIMVAGVIAIDAAGQQREGGRGGEEGGEGGGSGNEGGKGNIEGAGVFVQVFWLLESPQTAFFILEYLILQK